MFQQFLPSWCGSYWALESPPVRTIPQRTRQVEQPQEPVFLPASVFLPREHASTSLPVSFESHHTRSTPALPLNRTVRAPVPTVVRKTQENIPKQAERKESVQIHPSPREEEMPKRDNISLAHLAIVGSHNLGNTCYMNATVQALLSAKHFNTRLLDWMSVHQEDLTSLHPVASEYLELVLGLLNRKGQAVPALNLSALKSALCAKKSAIPVKKRDSAPRTYCGSRQEDAQECMVDILDCILDNPRNPEMNQFMSKRLGGTWLETRTCLNCNRQVKQSIPFTQFILPLKNERPNSLEQLIQDFEEPEMVEDYKCEVCKIQSGILEKQTVVDKTSSTILITLKRFDPVTLSKNNAIVNIPLVLKLGPRRKPYRLVGTANHSGGVSGGHYTAYAFRDKNEWYLANDSSTRRVSEQDIVHNPSVYLLVYEDVNDFVE